MNDSTRLLAGLVLILGVSAFSNQQQIQHVLQLQADTIRVRNIIVVDANGVERVRIAAPLPDPVMLGKRYNRGEAVSGILIFDSEGNERGGYVTDDHSRGAALTLDEMMRAAVHIGVSERGESHITFSNGMGSYTGFGMRLDTGPYLRMEDARGITTITPDSVHTEVRK